MLSIKRPTPTTVLYTVSTRSAATTFASRVQRTLSALLRLLVGTITVLLLLSKAQQTSPRSLPNYSTPSLPALSQFAAHCPWHWLLPISAAVSWLILRKGYTEESLLVLRGLGVQTSTSSPTYLTTASTRFIPTNVIQDIFIHEAFRGFEVKFYLAIVVEGEEDVVVVFPVCSLFLSTYFKKLLTML